MTVDTTSDAIAGATIELLEARLRRLTYLLGGATDWTGVPTEPEKPTSLDGTVSRRLARLERELERLSRSVPVVRDVIQLRTFDPTGLHLNLTIRRRDTTAPVPCYLQTSLANSCS